ncbi:MAG: heparinase II/III family protein [Clostridia bacterium]|nr:heparinase II/III family protein [Clostridia bacterium]
MTNESFPLERMSGLQVFPSPRDGTCVPENPPALIWLPLPSDQHDTVLYRCTVTDTDGRTVYSCETTGNTAVPDLLLDPGDYSWDVEAVETGVKRGRQRFTVSGDAVRFLRPTVEQVLDGLPAARPRHLFTKDEIPAILASRAEELGTLRRNIEQAYLDGLPERPMFHTDAAALPYREYFGRFRDFCDRNLVACALGYHLLNDETAGAFAKKLFLHLCDWNPSGPCSLCGPWGDEVGLSMARCLPAVFDLLYPLMNDKERRYAGETVARYAEKCERRISALNYSHNPGSSHVGRLPAYLGEAALTLWGTGIVPETTLRGWLNKALTIYNGVFPYFGGTDGSWAEGTFYSTSYTKWYLPFFSAVARYSGHNYLDRPFYRNYARYLLHFAQPQYEIHPFCDGYWCTPDSPEWPGFFAQNPFRIYAQVSGLPDALACDRRLAAPELFKLHLLDVFLPVFPSADSRTSPVTDADAFRDAGFVSLHSDHTLPEDDLHLMARASKFGPGSHRQPDNGAFALFFGGTALLTPSGYFGRQYGSAHHMNWLNTTKAHNAVLIDGIGQDWRNFRHTGEIVSCGIDGNGHRTAVLDLTASYPMLTRWIRILRVIDKNTAVIEDEIAADHPVTVTYALHTLSEPEAWEDGFRVVRNGCTMNVVPDAGQFVSRTITDRYDVDLNEGEPEEYHVTMPQQYHVYFDTEKKEVHRLRVTVRVV